MTYLDTLPADWDSMDILTVPASSEKQIAKKTTIYGQQRVYIKKS